jgi:exodeoxyribonuclease VII small subunit
MSPSTSDSAGGERIEGLSFEEALDRLEEIVRDLEEGKKGLEDSIHLYEEGRRLVRFCTDRLDEAQTRIEQLVRTEQGSMTESATDRTAPETSEDPSEGERGDRDLPF